MCITSFQFHYSRLHCAKWLLGWYPLWIVSICRATHSHIETPGARIAAFIDGNFCELVLTAPNYMLSSMCPLQIIDISMGLESSTLKFTSATGLGDFKHMASTMDDGDFYNGSQLKDFSAHTGTHVDAPSHFMNVCALSPFPDSQDGADLRVAIAPTEACHML